MEDTIIALAAVIGLIIGGTIGYSVCLYYDVPGLVNQYEEQIASLEGKYENQITGLENKYEPQLSESQEQIRRLNQSLELIRMYYLPDLSNMDYQPISNITEGWELILDDIHPVYFKNSLFSVGDVTPGYYGIGYHLMNAVSPPYSNINFNFIWNMDIPQAGYYEVYARWTNNTNRATDARYVVSYEGGEKAVIVNQMVNGGKWISLGIFPFIKGRYTVTVYNSVTGVVVADAIRIVKTDKPFKLHIPDIILDTQLASYNGTWNSGSTPGYYGDGYRANYNDDGSDTATWSFNIRQAGLWEVYAWWVEDFNRATDSPYTIYSTTPFIARVNQKIHGSRWVSLGQYEFDMGPACIVLSDDADGYVIADAVKLVYVQTQ